MWPTIIIAAIVGAIFVAIVVKEIVNKKKGRSSCSCGCGGCAFKEQCHSKANNK